MRIKKRINEIFELRIFSPFARDKFSKGSLLNCGKIVQNVPRVIGQQLFYCPNSLAKSFQILLHFITMLKLSKGPKLNCCRVKGSYTHWILLVILSKTSFHSWCVSQHMHTKANL